MQFYDPCFLDNLEKRIKDETKDLYEPIPTFFSTVAQLTEQHEAYKRPKTATFVKTSPKKNLVKGRESFNVSKPLSKAFTAANSMNISVH